jgi:SAM-dependent methyltransferase
MKDLSASDVEKMHYSQLVGLVKERNRCSGGIRTVQAVAANAFLSQGSRVLEIGSNTGFTSVNLSLLSGCSVVGIDVNPPSVEEATTYARENGVDGRVTFQVASALKLPFEDAKFDLVWASNVTSFIDDKATAVGEYLRVLKVGGYLAFVPIYYRKTPPADLVERVGKAINAPLRVWRRDEWIQLCHSAAEKVSIPLELVFDGDYEYLDRSKDVDAYCDLILSKPHLLELGADARKVAKERYSAQMQLFNANLQYCGFSIFLFQKRRVKEEVELFLSRRVQNA